MSNSPQEPGLHLSHYVLLAVFCLVLSAPALLGDRPLSGHEAMGAETAREMFAGHDWLVPRLGGLAWLERPPLPQWLSVAVAGIVGRCDQAWILRLAPLMMVVVVVALTARMAARWYGRSIGMLTGLILASMWEFWTFSSDPEADMVLCAIVTGAIALFVDLEFFRRPQTPGREASFCGRRPLLVLGFFVVWGLANLAKGMVFGLLMVGIPIGGYLLSNADWPSIRRYMWLWGWLGLGVVALAWPIFIYCQYPDILDLWRSDYGGRWSAGKADPVWYYAVTIPYVLLPWTIPALVGLRSTGGEALRCRFSPGRFLWIWALLPPAVFSIPDWKHHHYLLPCMAPWAVLAALGSVRIWRGVQRAPAWLRSPLVSVLTLGVAGDLALWVFGYRLPGPSGLVPALMIAWPLLTFLIAWALTQPSGFVAAGTMFTLLAAFYGLMYPYQSVYCNGYRDDADFLRQVRRLAPPDRLYVHYDTHPLETFHVLFYNDRRAVLLLNLTFLRDQRIKQREIYVLGRARDGEPLAEYGSVTQVLQSRHTKAERSPAERRTLFKLRFHDGLPRASARVRISPMQAVHRREGPYLTPTGAKTESH
jgi:4-amino-4-deoxy-L-arabinose transferase-like glycosyltransferase